MAQNPEAKLDEKTISLLLDRVGVQDSFSYRAVSRARNIAALLVGDEGKLEKPNIHLPSPFYLNGLSDSVLLHHQEKFLHRWQTDEKFFRSFLRFQLPLCHKGAENLIRDSLLLPPGAVITEAHVRRAVISAALVPLRQNVGSCFATAPAILIQEEQIDRFLLDLYDLLTTGRLRRVFGGKEYSVPLSLSWGRGDLYKKVDDHPIKESPNLQGVPLRVHPNMTLAEAIPESSQARFKGFVDHALLKAWEFTLASYSEIKMEFSRWNLYVSLGLHPSEQGGVGQVLYRLIDEKLQEANKKVQHYGEEYNAAVDQTRMVESMLRRAETESEVRRLKAEYQARYFHLQACRDMAEEFQVKAQRYANFFTYLVQQYDGKFPEYFQEIYDPEMGQAREDEDSPAGFRLVYKHGRSDASVWTRVQNAEEYIRFLVDFFNLSEPALVHGCETEGEKELTTLATTAVVHHVRTEEFLQSAMERTKKNGRTPWAYLSGGTMETLAKTYFAKEGPLHMESRHVEDPLDLCIFLLDTLKSLPPKITDRYLNDATKSMLIQSPSHAFLLKPGMPPFREGWQDRGFTYTWVRDNFILPMQEFYQRQPLPDLPDPLLFQSLPLVPREQCQAVLQELLDPWKVTPVLPKNLPPVLTALEVKNLAKMHLQDQKIDVHAKVAARARKIGLAPHLLFFADTNWLHNYFAFVVHPRTGKLDLWRVDRTGTVGAPMTAWSSAFSNKGHPWTLYFDPADYS